MVWIGPWWGCGWGTGVPSPPRPMACPWSKRENPFCSPQPHSSKFHLGYLFMQGPGVVMETRTAWGIWGLQRERGWGGPKDRALGQISRSQGTGLEALKGQDCAGCKCGVKEFRWRGYGDFKRGSWWGQKEEDCRGPERGDWESAWEGEFKEGDLGTLPQWTG